MFVWRKMRGAVLAAVTVLLSSCASTTSVVRSRFAMERRCSEDQVVVDERGGTLYRAGGCNHETTYVCNSTSGFKPSIYCVEEGLPSPPGYREPPSPPVLTPDPQFAAPR